MIGQRLDVMMLEVSSNFNDSLILSEVTTCSKYISILQQCS